MAFSEGPEKSTGTRMDLSRLIERADSACSGGVLTSSSTGPELLFRDLLPPLDVPVLFFMGQCKPGFTNLRFQSTSIRANAKGKSWSSILPDTEIGRASCRERV